MKKMIFFLLITCYTQPMDVKEQELQEPAPNSQTKITYLQLKVLSSLNDLKEAEDLYAKAKTVQNKRLVEACQADHNCHYQQLMVLEGQKKERQHKAKSNKNKQRKRTDSMIVMFDKTDSGTESSGSSDVSG